MGTNIDATSNGKANGDPSDVKGLLQRPRDHAEDEAIKASQWYFGRKC